MLTQSRLEEYIREIDRIVREREAVRVRSAVQANVPRERSFPSIFMLPAILIAAFAGATIAKANMWRTAFASFKFAKFLYLGPFLFGYVPAFSLDGSAMDIVKAFVLIIIGTYAYSYFLSGIWFRPLKRMFKKAPVS